MISSLLSAAHQDVVLPALSIYLVSVPPKPFFMCAFSLLVSPPGTTRNEVLPHFNHLISIKREDKDQVAITDLIFGGAEILHETFIIL
jgi:hypothetical protein